MADSGIARFFGGFTAEVTVKEQHTDDLTITTHPVERGAPVTDHAFKNPAQLQIDAGWSAAYVSNSVSGGDATQGTDQGTGQGLTDLYQQLLKAQASATLVSVQTGKRAYENMLIKSIRVTTDQQTENVLMVSAQLQEVILVDTIQTTMPSASNRADPKAAAGVADKGTKAPVETSNVVFASDGKTLVPAGSVIR